MFRKKIMLMITELLALLGVSLLTTSIIVMFTIPIIVIIVVYFITVRSLEKITVGDFKNKAVLITGCGSGFGFALTLKCLREGMTVFATFHSDKGKNKLIEAAKEIENSEKRLHVLTLDVINENSICEARNYVEEHLPDKKRGLWGLVNNAGQIGIGWDDWLTPKDYLNNFETNTLGMIRVTHAFKDLVKISRGRIIFMSSVLGKVAMPIMGSYCVSKFALTAYTDVVRAELAHTGVVVIGMEAGFFKTPITELEAAEEKVRKLWNECPPRVRKEYGKRYFQWTRSYMEGMDGFGDFNLDKVTSAYFSALTSKFPRYRWQIGNDAVYFFAPFSLLPTRWQHYLILFFLRIKKQPRVHSLSKILFTDLSSSNSSSSISLVSDTHSS